MIIIYDVDAVPRLAAGTVLKTLRAMPVTVVTGARQTGKTTLVQTLAPIEARAYLTLDHMDVLDQAQRAPDDLVGRANHLTIDEVQRAPDLLLAINVDALTISMTTTPIYRSTPAVAAEAIAIGILANCLLKMALALLLGTPHFGRVTGALLAAMAAAIVVAIWVVR